MARQELTVSQRELLVELHKFLDANGYSPSLRELRDIMGFSSTTAISEQLERLAEKDMVFFARNKARTLNITRAGMAALR